MEQDAVSDASVTTNPPTPAPHIGCPVCEHPLVYRQTIVRRAPIGDERWDYYECAAHGPFQYSHHSRVLRGTTTSVEQTDRSPETLPE